MAERCKRPGAVVNGKSELDELLTDLDRGSALSEGRWADKRRATRRRVRLPCTVRFLMPDGETVLTMEAHTRDISRSGLGFVTRKHFTRSAPVLIVIESHKGKPRKLTGKVAYSRVVQENWYLTGVEFEVFDCGHLERDSAERRSGDASAKAQRGHQANPISEASEGRKVGSRERALRSLAYAGSSKITSRQAINKVELLAASDDHVVRRAAIPALMQIPGAEGRDSLLRMLADSNWEIQVEAAEALGSMGAKDAIAQLKKLLMHRKAEVALRVAAVLGRLGDRSGLSVVSRYLPKDNPHTREAVRVFGIITGKRFRLSGEGIAQARQELAKLRPR
ncbi:MAG: HEAT repeat domain-containing protein [Phycisphaerales bacterium]|nr:MAG: HEAT repeat domain-containing protein [Phycisphaerales bacterium]